MTDATNPKPEIQEPPRPVEPPREDPSPDEPPRRDPRPPVGPPVIVPPPDNPHEPPHEIPGEPPAPGTPERIVPPGTPFLRSASQPAPSGVHTSTISVRA